VGAEDYGDVLNPQPKEKPILLKGKAKQLFRQAVAKRSHGRCDICHLHTPLQDWGTEFNWYRHGHVAHIKGYGAGGGDTMDNVRWLCPRCHLDVEHGPQWSKEER